MFDEYIGKAENLIISATTPAGIKALAIDVENYGRVWARDSMIAGLAGLLRGNEQIITGMQNAVCTLGRHQHYTGAIPSNVTIDDERASYGSLAGRVDATTWWLIGLALLINHEHEPQTLEDRDIKVQKALSVLEAWEYNGRHLIYTPLSGNWADEYPLHGYLLYDNVLRYWAVKLWSGILKSEVLSLKAEEIYLTVKSNFWPQEGTKTYYHPKIKYDADQSYFYAGFHPGGIYNVFDAAGNGLALLLNFANDLQISKLIEFVDSVFNLLDKPFLPAFWPVISEEDVEYPSIANNYAYQFKNFPHHFHNGGIWPVMMGLFALAMTKVGRVDIVDKMQTSIYPLLIDSTYPFAEYFDSKNFKPGGKKELCFSAAGCIFMAQKNKSHIEKVLKLD